MYFGASWHEYHQIMTAGSEATGGTGTEDYYGYAWCRPEIFSHPFIAQPSGSGNFHPGLTINMRYRVLDAIPFKSSISSNIELWHWLPATINYALTAYWYVLSPYEINIKRPCYC